MRSCDGRNRTDPDEATQPHHGAAAAAAKPLLCLETERCVITGARGFPSTDRRDAAAFMVFFGFFKPQFVEELCQIRRLPSAPAGRRGVKPRRETSAWRLLLHRSSPVFKN